MLTVALFAQAQEDKVWTLDDCMRFAVENSYGVRKQILASNNSAADKDAAIASFFPSVSTSIGAQYNFGRSIDPETNTYNNTTVFYNSYGVSTQIPVFTGGRLVNQWLQSVSNLKMSRNAVQKEKDDIALAAMQAYMDVIYYSQTIEMARKKLAESSQVLHKTRRQEELGMKSAADVAQFEAQVAADEYTLTQQENLLSSAMLTLKQKMNYPTEAVLSLDTAITSACDYLASPSDTDAIYDFALANNPTALDADFNLKNYRYQYRVSKGALLPTIYFGAGYSTNYIDNLKAETAPLDFKSQFKNNRGEYVYFTLSFPIFDGLSKVTSLRKARNNMKSAEVNREEVRRQLRIAVEQSVNDRNGYAKEVKQMRKKVQTDSIAYRTTLRKYEEGLMSTIDVQTNANNLLSSEAELLQRKLMYIMKSRLVDYYDGKPLIRE
jgi:outer membrane protein